MSAVHPWEGNEVPQAAPQLRMVGVSHRRSSPGLLEQVAVRREDLPTLLETLQSAGYAEAVLLSTCSRTEIYARSGAGSDQGLIEILAAQAGVPRTSLDAGVTVLAGQAVVEHLFRVTAGLESRVVGEVDVVDQVRLAHRAAQSAGITGPHLDRLFRAAVRCGVRVRSSTTLGQQGRSLACRAVDVGLETLSEVGVPQVLVVGSGQMAAAATERLTALGHPFRVAARNEAYAARLAGHEQVCPLTHLVDGIRRADLLICATSAANPVVTVDHVNAAMAERSRALAVVDLSVPHNVDRAVAASDLVTLVDLSALNDDAAEDPVVQAAVQEATNLVVAAADRYRQDLAAQDVGTLIGAFRSQVEQTCRDALRRQAGPLAPEDLAEVAHSVAGKLLHRPTLALRAAAAAGDTAALALLCDAFGIQPEHVDLADLAG
jgi:glutamyl-tRNA reductase